MCCRSCVCNRSPVFQGNVVRPFVFSSFFGVLRSLVLLKLCGVDDASVNG